MVRRQHELGIDVPGDGEFGKSMGHRVNYGAWMSYAYHRLGGLDLGGPDMHDLAPRRSSPGQLVLTSFADRRDRTRFAAAYADPESGRIDRPSAGTTGPVCVGPLSYIGGDAIRTDIANFKAALERQRRRGRLHDRRSHPAAPRGWRNAYYKTDEEFLFAAADAMREEYQAIVEAGLVLQLDDPALATNWDMINPEPSVEDYRKFAMMQVAALNHAIRGLPRERIRFHLCWGSWHGPHTTDIPLRDIVERHAGDQRQAYSFEAGNVRHEHEWKVWQDVKLPDDKLILPGVVSHATNVVEHPELVARTHCCASPTASAASG